MSRKGFQQEKRLRKKAMNILWLFLCAIYLINSTALMHLMLKLISIIFKRVLKWWKKCFLKKINSFSKTYSSRGENVFIAIANTLLFCNRSCEGIFVKNLKKKYYSREFSLPSPQRQNSVVCKHLFYRLRIMHKKKWMRC